jgi:hypothetical protein
MDTCARVVFRTNEPPPPAGLKARRAPVATAETLLGLRSRTLGDAVRHRFNHQPFASTHHLSSRS